MMIRVLQILPTLERNGLETFVMNVYRAIDKTELQFDFLTFQKGGDYCDEIKSLGGSIYYIPSRRSGFLVFNKNLFDFFRTYGTLYHAVHYHESSLTSLEPLFYARMTGIPVRIIHSHNSQISGSKLHYFTHYFGKLFIKNLATHYFGCSDKAIDWMYRWTGIKSKAVIINNGIDTNNFKFDVDIRTRMREQLNVEGQCVIGHVGRFSTVKNQSFLLDIFKAYLSINPNSHLIFIGVGKTLEMAQKKACELNLDSKVSFLGLRSDVNNYLQAFDIFVMPSFYEGLPVVLVEAQTSGLPVVCSDTISKMSKLTPNYVDCSLSKTSKEWAEAIYGILSRYTRKDNSELIKEEGFDIGTIIAFLFDIYTKVYRC